MNSIKSLNTNNPYWGFAVILMLGVLFLLAVLPMVTGSKEGLYAAKGASYSAVNSHTGSDGDAQADQYNYDDDDLRETDPSLWYEMNRGQGKDGFLNNRFPGPQFSESSARMLTNVESNLVNALRAHDQQIGSLTQPAAVTEITQGPNGSIEGISGMQACDWIAGMDTSGHPQGGNCGYVGHMNDINSDMLSGLLHH